MKPFVGSHTLLAPTVPWPLGVLAGRKKQCGVSPGPTDDGSVTFNVFMIRLPKSPASGFANAWLKTSKNPARNWNFVVSVMLKFLNKVTSKFLVFGLRIYNGDSTRPSV